tara:strand:+ start:177 stop:638 length:462 start_codon:yes stop_codon:yes gene_type:complete
MKKLIIIFCIIFVASCSVNNEDDLNRFEIQKLYRLYVDDFIANDFESIASYFDVPVDFKSFNDIAETNEDVIRFYKDLKANIQEGYAYSVIDNISVTNIKVDSYLLCADYSRYNKNDKLLFEGRTHYVYINTADGWKINSLEPKDRITYVPCI